MTPGRAAAYIGGGMLLAAWLSSAATSPQDSAPIPEPRPEPTSGTDSIASDVQAQAARLRSRLAAAPAPNSPSRNPFAFAVAEVPRQRQTARAVEPEPLAASPVVATELPLTLVGVAEQESPNGVTRTALIVGPSDELFMVTEGQEVAGGYRVTAVGADVVELKDASTGSIRRLVLRQ
jgi:hypothetical protein